MTLDYTSDTANFVLSNRYSKLLFRSMRALGMLADPPLPDDRSAVEALAEQDSGYPIPAYKICSNDAFWTHPAEVARSLAALDGWPKPDVLVALVIRDSLQPLDEPTAKRLLALWREWIAFLREAARTDGFITS